MSNNPITNEKRSQKKKATSARFLSLFDLPDNVIMLTSSFYTMSDIWVLRPVCRRFYNLSILGYHAYEREKILLSLRVCDGTGSMGDPLSKARACMIKKTLEFEKEFPEYTLLEGGVVYRDPKLTPVMERVQGVEKVADHIYSLEPYIIIQRPVQDRYKVYRQTKNLKARGGNMVTGTESLDQALVQLNKTLGGYMINPGLSNPSVTIIDVYRDTVGHFMFKDGCEIWHEFYPIHGMDHDWVRALKSIRSKNAIMVDFNMGGNCPISKYIGLIFAVGGFSFNITTSAVFESVRLSKAIVKSEIALREYLSQVYAKISSQMFGATRQEIKKAVMDYVDKSETKLPDYLADLNPENMNTPSPEFCDLVNSCSTMRDFERKGLLPTEAVCIYFARLIYGKAHIVGKVDPKAAQIYKKRKLQKSGKSKPSFDHSDYSGSCDLDLPSCGAPSLMRTTSYAVPKRSSLKGKRMPLSPPLSSSSTSSLMPVSDPSCLMPPPRPRPKHPKSVGFKLKLNMIHEIPKESKKKEKEDEDEMPDLLAPSLNRELTCSAPTSGVCEFDDNTPFALLRTATEAYSSGMHETEEYGEEPSGAGLPATVPAFPTPPLLGMAPPLGAIGLPHRGGGNPFIGNPFIGTPWVNDHKPGELNSFFKPGKVRPASRELLTLKKPRLRFDLPIMGLNKYALKEKDLNKVRERILKEQPYQKEIIEAGSFKNYVRKWVKPPPSIKEANIQRSVMESPRAEDEGKCEEPRSLPPAIPSLGRTSSLFTTEEVPEGLLLTRSMSEVSGRSTQVRRNLDSQFD